MFYLTVRLDLSGETPESGVSPARWAKEMKIQMLTSTLGMLSQGLHLL